MISMNKTYQTRDGMPVRILTLDAKGTYPVVGLVDVGNSEYAHHWTPEGKADFRSYVKTNYDLVEVGDNTADAEKMMNAAEAYAAGVYDDAPVSFSTEQERCETMNDFCAGWRAAKKGGQA